MSLLKLTTGDPAPLTPVEFFTQTCPKVLSVHGAICKKLGGTYSFQLFGDGGGQWTLDYAGALVHEGLKDDADLYVEMDAADFTELLKGTLDVEGAADDGRIRIRGDASLFGNLVAVLEPASA
jgi:hypothetical protein